MATRREAREWAVQILFQLDLNPAEDLEEVFERFFEDKKADKKSLAFARKLVSGVVAHRVELDARIAALSDHWDIPRMGVVDRNVIRMALQEMLHNDDVPPIVTINEAVDIAKYFSNRESGRFVNGILDHVRRDLDRSAGQAEDANG